MILLDFSKCLLPHAHTVANAAPISVRLIQDRKDKLLLAASDKVKPFPGDARKLLLPCNGQTYVIGLSFQQERLQLCISFSQILSHHSGMNCNKREQEFGMSVRSTHRHYLLHAIAKFISISQNRKLIQ